MKTKILILVLFLIGSFSAKSQLVINELFLSNGSKVLTSDFDYSNWIELYNNSDSEVSTSGLYLSIDSAGRNKWSLPVGSIASKTYKCFFITGKNDGDHTLFKADADKGSIFLSNNEGAILQRVDYPKQYYNVSYGRMPDASGPFAHLLQPSFEKENISDTSSLRPNTVSFSIQGGFFSSSVDLELINTFGEGNIFYTLNGAEPNSASLLYNSPIHIDSTTVVRARILIKGEIPGAIKSNTFFINTRKPDLPVLPIVTDPRNLFNDTIGIYVKGTNGIAGFCSETPVNWNQDWERSANFELFDTAAKQQVNQIVGIKIAGGCSRTIDQKSFAITARSKYGKSRLNYKFFSDRDFENFNSILARTGANDWSFTLCRDNVMQKLSDRFMNIEHQAVQPSVIFINGKYYGLQHLYERSGEDLIEAKYGYNQDSIDLGEKNGVLITGDVSDFANLLEYVNNHTLSETEAYNYVAERMDIDNFIDYNIFEIYIGNHDWPGSNSKYWRPKKPGSKWRWILYDTDFGFGLYEQNASHQTLAMMLTINNNLPNPEWSTRLFRKLLENPEFKRKFVNRFYAHINSTFKTEDVLHVIDSVSAIIKNEIPYHYERWGLYLGNWERYLNVMKDFARERPEIMRSHLRDLLGAGENVNLSCKSIAPGFGYISLDSVATHDTVFTGIFAKGSIIDIRFLPSPGYVFAKAVKVTNGHSKEIFTSFFRDTLNADVRITVYFEKAQPIAHLVINEIAVKNNLYPDEFGENDDWIEVYNNGTDTVELSSLYLSDSLSYKLKYRVPYSNGLPIVIAPGEYKIFWADNQAFQCVMHTNFKLKAKGEYIGVFQMTGNKLITLDSVSFNLIAGNYKSFGRFPNISGPFKSLFIATPLTANSDNEPVFIPEKVMLQSSFYYNAGLHSLVIKQTADQSDILRISDFTGRLVWSFQLTGNEQLVNVGHLKKGIYLVKFVHTNKVEKIFIY